MPFLSFVTRCCKRPRGLIRVRDSLKAQSDHDFSHVLLVDRIGIGIDQANQSFYRYREHVTGRFVFIIDDDDEIVDSDFVAELKKIVAQHKPDVVMVKTDYMGVAFPPLPWWGQPPTYGKIGSSNCVVRNEVWQKHIEHFRNPGSGRSGGDFFFIDSVFSQTNICIYWWNRIITRIDHIGRGQGEDLPCV